MRGNTGGYTERWVRVIEGRLHFYNTLAVSTASLCSALLCSAPRPARHHPLVLVYTHTFHVPRGCLLLTPCRCVSWLAACLLPGCFVDMYFGYAIR